MRDIDSIEMERATYKKCKNRRAEKKTVKFEPINVIKICKRVVMVETKMIRCVHKMTNGFEYK